MLTKEQIKKNVQNDPFWEMPDDATNKEWEWYDEAYEELEESNGFSSGESKDDDDDDDDESWDDDE